MTDRELNQIIVEHGLDVITEHHPSNAAEAITDESWDRFVEKIPEYGVEERKWRDDEPGWLRTQAVMKLESNNVDLEDYADAFNYMAMALDAERHGDTEGEQ